MKDVTCNCSLADDALKFKAERDYYRQQYKELKNECDTLRKNWQWEIKQRALMVDGFNHLYSALVNIRDLSIQDMPERAETCYRLAVAAIMTVNLHPPIGELS